MGDSRTCSSINHNDSIDVKETNDAIQRETICKSNIPRKLRKEWNLEHKQGIGFCYQEVLNDTSSLRFQSLYIFV